ncbi:unnamed protein product [Rhizophagus irregularis]|nr:unnamed protein product [Rhizophagus irregularis]
MRKNLSKKHQTYTSTPSPYFRKQTIPLTTSTSKKNKAQGNVRMELPSYSIIGNSKTLDNGPNSIRASPTGKKDDDRLILGLILYSPVVNLKLIHQGAKTTCILFFISSVILLL